MIIEEWYLQNLVCPRDQGALCLHDDELLCENGHRYPVIDGIPVMLIDDILPTLHVIGGSINALKASPQAESDTLFLATWVLTRNKEDQFLSTRRTAVSQWIRL